MFKKGIHFLIGVVSIFSCEAIFAQQESQYSQYMYNTMIINPAYTGSRGVPSFFGLYRAQWVGIEGAPKTATLSFHTPFEDKNVGLGASLYHESIGPQATNTLMVDFSYTLDFDNSKLAFGLKGTAGFYQFNRNKLNLLYGADVAFSGNENVFSPNIGAGVYWYSDNYYLGFSVPYILSSRTFSSKEKTVSIVNSVQHYHLMGGYVFDVTDDVKFKPAALLKIVKGAPLQADLSANFMFNEKFVLGAAYRWSAAVSLMAGFQINQNWFIGYAYDYETTELSKYNSGSHEIFLRYEFLKDARRIISPRFF